MLLHSSIKTNAILLAALIQLQSDVQVARPTYAGAVEALIPKLARGLLDSRKNGAWRNTQENVFGLIAMRRYFSTYEADTPNFTAQVWLGAGGKGVSAQRQFEGRSIEEVLVPVPMEAVLALPKGSEQEKTKSLVIAKFGQGRAYYRIAMRVSPTNTDQPAADRGFSISRTYKLDSGEPCDNMIAAASGQRITVELKVVVKTTRHHVAVVDNLAAGFEVVADSLSKPQRGYTWHWYEHKNVRDARVEVFARTLYPGTYTLSYIATAVTPGQFQIPPAKAEEMYSPEVFGTTSANRAQVRAC
jgi:uncharacterized protein YfaS (alpha-2-macroglobulin family)